jgi:hypothetical protein
MAIKTSSPAEVQEILKEIEKMMDEMIKKGLMPALSLGQKQNIAKNVFKKLNEAEGVSLTLDDFKNNPDTRKALGLSCMAECRPNNKFDYTMLFKKENDLKPEELKKQLKSIFDDMLKLHPKMDPKKRKELENEFDALAEKLSHEFNKRPEMLCENKTAFNLIFGCFDAASDFRRQMYGVDTHVTGAQFIPVQAEPIGDLLGVVNLSFGMGDSFQASKEKVDPCLADPIGIIMTNIINNLGSGNLNSTIEQELIDARVIPKPDPSMRLDPPGSA